jgi:hypothetical protein
MYHPMLTFAVMQTRQEDLLRELRRDQVRGLAQRTGPTNRTPLRQRLAAYVAGRPRPTVTHASWTPYS